MDVNSTQYSLQWHEENEEEKPEETSEVVQVESKQEEVDEKPLSYFEQLLEKNRRQLRGDSTDE